MTDWHTARARGCLLRARAELGIIATMDHITILVYEIDKIIDKALAEIDAKKAAIK
jgi:hypothetical protein